MCMDVMRSARASYSQRNCTKLGHIPGEYGIPVIGKTKGIITDPYGLFKEYYEKYGPVSRISLTLSKGVLALGPEITKEILLDKQQNFSTHMGYKFALGELFAGGLLMRDFSEHKFHRRIMQTAFKNDALRGYIDTMNGVLQDQATQWQTDREFLMYPVLKNMTLTIAARVFIGSDMGDQTNQIINAFVKMLDSVTSIVRLDLPGTLYHRGMKARRFLTKYFINLTAQKRQQQGTDMMSYLCRERDENDAYFSDETIAEHLIFLMLAAHDTTTSALINSLYLLAAYPHWQTKLREELNTLDSHYLSYDQLDTLPLLENVFKETTRLFPPAINFMRRTVRECELGGYTIPANTVVTVSPAFTQRMEEYWADPLAFDPERFAPPREEHKQHPFAWFPFGGGAHKCIGLHFANMLYKCILFNILRQYKLSLPAGYTEPTDNSNMSWVPLPKPKDDLPLILHPIH